MQMPRKGLVAASTTASRAPLAASWRMQSGHGALAGDDDLSAERIVRGSAVTRTCACGATCSSALNRAQVAHSVIDDRDFQPYGEPLVDGTIPGGARIGLRRHAQRAREALNMVSHWWCAFSPRRLSMCSVTWAWLTKPWKNSCTRSTSNSPIRARVNFVVVEPRAAGEIDHHARQRLVERHVGVAEAAHARLVADRPGDGLSQRDADVLDGVVRIDVQVALGFDLEVEHAVARHLVEHVLEEGRPVDSRAAPRRPG